MNDSTAPASALTGACSDCALSRRSFVGAATAAALATLIEACGSTLTGPATGGAVGGGGFTVTLANFPSLASVGGVARVDQGGSPTALVRTGASTYVAVSMICTHQGSTINIVSGGYLCPNHGARYSSTGIWQGGQVTSSLPTFPATYDAAAGTVTVARP